MPRPLAPTALLLAAFACLAPAPLAAASRFRIPTAAEPPSFPRDHGSHDDARVEWWYVTGHLATESGERLGFQLTFFRTGLLDEPRGERSSAWAARDLFLAHLALTDVKAGTFRYAERRHRTGVGAAVAREETLDVSVDEWRLVEMGGRFALLARDGSGDGAVELSLLLTPEKPPVLHGDNGLSRKGPEPEAVSRYVSLTRLKTEGWVRRGGTAARVTGSSWLDHEWGPGSMGKESAGWDWLSIQLDDGRDLMLYLMRGAAGAPTRFASGTLVERDGTSRALGPADFAVEPTATWRSPRSGGVYPARWSVRVPSAGLLLDVVPLVADQELVTDRSTFVTYWEGACEVRSAGGDARRLGRAYVELTGYAGKGALGTLSGGGSREMR